MGGKPFYANVNCDLSWIFVPENPDRHMYYLACERCKKKVMEDPAGYSCESCSQVFEKAVPTYNFTVRISDCSGSLTMSCFGEIGETILGINCQQFFAMHEDTYAVKDLTMNRLYDNPLTLVIRAKVDPNGYSEDGPCIRYTAVRSAEHSFQNANANLL